MKRKFESIGKIDLSDWCLPSTIDDATRRIKDEIESLKGSIDNISTDHLEQVAKMGAEEALQWTLEQQLSYGFYGTYTEEGEPDCKLSLFFGDAFDFPLDVDLKGAVETFLEEENCEDMEQQIELLATHFRECTTMLEDSLERVKGKKPINPTPLILLGEQHGLDRQLL